MNNNKIPSTDSTSASEVCQPAQSSKSQRRNSNTKGQYTLGPTLGEGAFAKVKLATHNPTQEKIAIKIINKSHLLKEEKDVIRIKKEISILKKIRHKNIIQLYEIMESKSSLYIVMEYCEGKELYDHIVQHKRLNEEETCKFFQQIINAVEYLHDQGIIHRDLKPENILLDDKMNIKISDFGLSTFYSKGQLLATPCGTPSYAPPEMLRGELYNGESSDVWSCGIILYAMLCGKLPFAESQEDLICKKIINKDYDIPDYVPKQAKELLNLILNVNPKERLTIDQIKRHSWFNFIPADLRPGIALGKQTPPIDENILLRVQSYGYDINKCRHNLLHNKFDSLTSVYYLLLKQHIKQGGKSISDLSSDDYLRYIINLNDIFDKAPPSKGTNQRLIPQKGKVSENNSPCTKKIEGKLISKFHSNYILPTNATNSNMTINNTNSNINNTFKDSFVSSFIATKKQKGSKPKLRLPQPQQTISSNVSSPSITTISCSDTTNNKQLHLAKHALYKKKRLELTNLKKSQGASEAIPKTQQADCYLKGLSCANPHLHPLDKVNDNVADEEEDLLFEEELNNIDSMSKNVNIIQYIAQKLIGNPFYGSFDISMSSRKNTLENKLKLKEESKDDQFINNFPSTSDYETMIKDQIEEEEDEIGDEYIKDNINTNFLCKIKGNLSNHNIKPKETEATRHKKSIKHSFIKKQEVFIYDYSVKNSNGNGNNGSNDHQNKFLDISTTQLENSIERSLSINKDLRRFSLSPEKNIAHTNSNGKEGSLKQNSGNTGQYKQLIKCKQGLRRKKHNANYNKEAQGIHSDNITINTNTDCNNNTSSSKTTLTAGNSSNKKYTIHLVKPSHHSSKVATSTTKPSMNNNTTHSTDNLFKSPNNNNDITDNSNKTTIVPPSSSNLGKSNQMVPTSQSMIRQTKTIPATATAKQRNQENREKVIPHPKKNNESGEILLEKSMKHTRTGSANETILKKTIQDNKVKINLNEINDTTKVFNSICFYEIKPSYDNIRIYKGPIDLMCCSTLSPHHLYAYLANLFKSERFSCVKLSLLHIKCSKSRLSFECEVMLLDTCGNSSTNSTNNQTKTSYAKFRFKQGDFLVYRKILTSIGQCLQALG